MKTGLPWGDVSNFAARLDTRFTVGRPRPKTMPGRRVPCESGDWWTPARAVRASGRLVGLFMVCTGHWLRLGRDLAFAAEQQRPFLRARALQITSTRILRVLGVRREIRGSIPVGGFLVSNHLSYLDVLVLGSNCPMTFVAKREVSRWPLIGPLVRRFGCLFIERRRPADVARVAGQVESRIRDGVTVCVFPEGTTSDGAKVYPFKSGLFGPAARLGRPVTAVWIGYEVPFGSVEANIRYSSKMSFPAHLMRLLSLEQVTAHVEAVRLPAGGARSRKDLAGEAHRIISGIAGRERGHHANMAA